MKPLFVDTDNALGSPFGDIDDAFAIAALLKSGVPVEALSTVFGNSFEPLIFRNTKQLADLCGYGGKIVRGAPTWWTKGSESSRYLSGLGRPVRALALGPLTNFANGNLDRVTEIVFVATNLNRRLPAWRCFDFNHWKDPRAVRRIVSSSIPLTCVPCDVARRLRASEKDLAAIGGPLGDYLRRHARRWFLRSKLLKFVDSVPIWDLTAAMYVLDESLFRTTETTLRLGRMGQAVFGAKEGRPVRVVTGFDPAAVWKRFLCLVSN